MPAFFVTGTDTEVGKTFVSAALLQAANQAGQTSLGLKPVAAGCEVTDQGLRNEDALAHMEYANRKLHYEEVNPVALQPAIAPHIAAREIGLQMSAADLASHCRNLIQPGEFTLVEGAGGWLVPLNESENFADIAVDLALPVILVVGLKLGCINHALLSAESIARSGLELAGWVANSSPEGMDRQRQNIATLKQRLSAPCLGELPWTDTVTAAELLNIKPLLGG